MTFTVTTSEANSEQWIYYNKEDKSIITRPFEKYIDFELQYGTLTIAVAAKRLVGISGYVDTNACSQITGIPPSATPGRIRVNEVYASGFSYLVEPTSLVTGYDQISGWFCFGAANAIQAQPIRIFNNCIAVLSPEGSLLTLWLKPESPTD